MTNGISKLVEVSRSGGVFEVALNRPEARNALSIELCDAIADAVKRIDEDPEARVLVLRGKGPVFCSGADFSLVSAPEGGRFLPRFESMLEAVSRVRLPTIAAIHGAALGGGFQLASVCDFRIAATAARIGIPAARLGVVVNLENVERLLALVGVAVAKEVLMTARMFTGEEAKDVGLVTANVPQDELESAVASFATELAALAPLAVQGAKAAVQFLSSTGAARTGDPQGALGIDALVAEAYASEDLSEGLRAMEDKRAPRFKRR